MDNYKTTGTFDATEAALEQVYNYYGLDTADLEEEYEELYDDYRSLYSTPNKSYSSNDSEAGAVVAAILAFLGVFMGVIVICGIAAIVTAIARWSVFKKAGEDGWEALIPVHSEIVEMKLGGIKTYWYFLNLLVFPLAIGPIIIAFWKSIKLAHSFGKGTGFGVGLALVPVIFYPILAWGNASYIGPQNGSNQNENIFYTETNTNASSAPINQPIVTNNDLSSYTDPNAVEPKVEENPIKTNDDKTE